MVKQPTSRDVAYTERWYKPFLPIVSLLGGRIFAAGAAFLSNVLVARQLGPDDYGAFYLLFTVMTLVAGLTGPPLDTVLVRFAAQFSPAEFDRARGYFIAVFWMKWGMFVLTVTVASLISYVAFVVFDLTVPGLPLHGIQYLLAACTGGAVLALWGYSQAWFQAQQRFRVYLTFEILAAVLRLLGVVVLLALGVKHLHLYFSAYLLPAVMVWLLGWSRLPRALLGGRLQRAALVELLHFGKWVLLAAIANTLVQRVDFLWLSLTSASETMLGQYGAALSLVLIGELIVLSNYHVLLPRASQAYRSGSLVSFLRQSLRPTALFALCLALLIPVSPWLRALAFGSEYAGSEYYFSVLLIGVIAATLSTPFGVALYALGVSQTVAVWEFLRLAGTVSALTFCVPLWGGLGAAIAVSIARLFCSVGISIHAYRTISRQKASVYP